MKRLKYLIRDVPIKRKIMYIYICIGTIPMLILGIFTYHQERSSLLERDQRLYTDALSQGVDQLKSQMLIYNNLSDYITFNQPISEVLAGDYSNSYEMYEQYVGTIDPVLSSLRYFNPNINQITIYVDRDIAAHDTSVVPLRELTHQEWYENYRDQLSQSVKWIVNENDHSALSVRTMPILEQSAIKGLMYLNVNYNNLFRGFEEMSQEDYGVYVLDSKEQVLYHKDNFGDKYTKKRLKLDQLLQEKKKVEQQKKSDYMVVSSELDVEDWTVILYRPDAATSSVTNLLVILVLGIAGTCILTSMVASYAFGRFVVSDIKKLRDNMQEVEDGHLNLTVTSDAQDEVGELVRGFGSMLGEINRLIHEVYESKLTMKKSEMTALQAQINPHFLYNSLSLINWKALEAGQEDISRITLALSSFYRTSLNRGRNVLTIEKELENMRSYLEIQSCMHDNDFDVVIDVDESILQYQTLNLLLQPLVENAIDHGIDLKEEGRGYIKIIGRQEQDHLQLIVEDNGVGIPADVLDDILEIRTKGYGVRNVNQRIQLYYGEEYCLQISSEQGKGTRCVITIPKRMEE